ncbi:MAG: hypothetical protein J0H69_09540 [Burkholderiales bacterium]|nr:hypothetical protein [Burkholderiales bacterium]
MTNVNSALSDYRTSYDPTSAPVPVNANARQEPLHPALSTPFWVTQLNSKRAYEPFAASRDLQHIEATLRDAQAPWARLKAPRIAAAMLSYCQQAGMPQEHAHYTLQRFLDHGLPRLQTINGTGVLSRLVEEALDQTNSRFGTAYQHTPFEPAESSEITLGLLETALILALAVFAAVLSPFVQSAISQLMQAVTSWRMQAEEDQAIHPQFQNAPLYPNRLPYLDQRSAASGGRRHYNTPLRNLPGVHVLTSSAGRDVLIPGTKYIFAVLPSGGIAMAPELIATANGYGHPEMARHGKLGAAGEFMVDEDGTITQGDNVSGHYLTDHPAQSYLDPDDCNFKPPRPNDSLKVAEEAFARLGVPSRPGAWAPGTSSTGAQVAKALCEEELQLRKEAEEDRRAGRP